MEFFAYNLNLKDKNPAVIEHTYDTYVATPRHA